MPDVEPWLVSEALIELGATVCTKTAQCMHCPLKKECLSFRHHLQDRLPKRKERLTTFSLKRVVGVILCGDFFLIEKGAQGKVMADLYEFPYIDSEQLEALSAQRLFEEKLGMPLKYIKPLEPQKHTFTRYRVQLFPHLMEAKEMTKSHMWKKMEELQEMAFSSGHRRILQNYEKENLTY